MKIKDLVKNKRKELKESQEEFGKRFGVSHAAVSDLETGKTKRIDEDMLNFVFNEEKGIKVILTGENLHKEFLI